MVLLIIIPTKWLYFIGNINPTFSGPNPPGISPPTAAPSPGSERAAGTWAEAAGGASLLHQSALPGRDLGQGGGQRGDEVLDMI